jgi:hypothetical protein
MSKFIKLLTSAYVNGAMRHPHEGVLHLTDKEAQRLLDDKAGEDVTDDFTADDRQEVPVMGLDASGTSEEVARKLDPVPHQSEIPPATTTETASAPEAAKPAKKETAK